MEVGYCSFSMLILFKNIYHVNTQIHLRLNKGNHNTLVHNFNTNSVLQVILHQADRILLGEQINPSIA